jgi:hypothetical protein
VDGGIMLRLHSEHGRTYRWIDPVVNRQLFSEQGN